MQKPVLSLTLAFSLAFASASAQGPTYSYVPKAGDVHIMYLADTVGIEPGAAGANVTWDYSSLVPNKNNTQLVREFKASTGIPYADQFPDATMVLSLSAGQKFYYISTENNQMEKFGYLDNSSGNPDLLKYNNTQIELSLPMAYNSLHNDDFAGSYAIDGDSFYFRGRIKVHADAYGTMKLRGKTFNNVLRYVSESWELDSTSSDLTEFYEKRYNYVTADQKEHLLDIVYSEIKYGGDTYAQKSVGFNENGSVISTIDEPGSFGTTDLNVYPNPANGQAWLQFDMNNARQGSIRILDLSGKVMIVQSTYFSAGRNVHPIDTETLPKGMYIIQIQAEDSTPVSARLVVN